MAIMLITFTSGCSFSGSGLGPYNGISPDPMTGIVVTSADPVHHPLTSDDYRFVVKTVTEQAEQAGLETSSLVESVLVEAGVTGAVGVVGGFSQELLYAGADGGAAAGLYGIIYTLFGGQMGAREYSSAKIQTLQTLVQQAIAKLQMLYPERWYICVAGSYVRTLNTSKKVADGYRKKYMFSGDRVGEPKPRRRELQAGEPVF